MAPVYLRVGASGNPGAVQLDDRITIIHAPNGFGKTVILKMIAAMFGGSLATFREYEFKSIQFEFDSKLKIIVTSKENEDGHPVFEEALKKSYKIELLNEKTKQVWDPDLQDSKSEEVDMPLSAIERYVPGLRRIGSRVWATTSGEKFTYGEVLERYWRNFPPSYRRRRRIPEWLDEIRKNLSCKLIETQRLLVQKEEMQPATERDLPMVLAVKTYSEALSTQINKILAESATLSQSLDRTFPNRILERMNHPPQFDENTVRTKLADLEQKRGRLAKVDLLDKTDGGSIISHATFDDAALRILAEYASDAEKKLSVFDNLLSRIELFIELVNERFTFKAVSIKRDVGLTFSNFKDKPLGITSLSSGEQHELILLYNLIFNTREHSLILLDEPEISLHIAWQKKFLADLRRIIQLSPMDVVLATHSPQIISGNIDLTVQLKEPKIGRTKHK